MTCKTDQNGEITQDKYTLGFQPTTSKSDIIKKLYETLCATTVSLLTGDNNLPNKDTFLHSSFIDDNDCEDFVLYYTCIYEGLELFLIFKSEEEFLEFSNKIDNDPLLQDTTCQFNTLKRKGMKRGNHKKYSNYYA